MVESLEDYSSLLSFDFVREPLHVREVIPKDFYLAAALQDREEGFISLLIGLILNPQVLHQYSMKELHVFLGWLEENELQQSILEVDNWLSVAIGLLKGQWGTNLEWLESQPFSKVRILIDASTKYFTKK